MLNPESVAMPGNLFSSLEYVPPKFLKKVLSGCLWEGSSDSGVLALTFDDGPDPGVTPAVLDALEKCDGHGTFFLRGDHALKHPDIVREIRDRGHIIGNHTMSHPRLFLSRRKKVEREIDDAGKIIADITGTEPLWFRPPYGIFDVTVAKAARKRDMTLVLWTVISGDYGQLRPADDILGTVRPFIRGGAIQVFHDTTEGGSGKLPGIIETIGSIAKNKGLCLGGVDELSRMQKWERR